jgi:hypothetical protein
MRQEQELGSVLCGAVSAIIVYGITVSQPYYDFVNVALGIFAAIPIVFLFVFTQWVILGLHWPYWCHLLLAATILLFIALWRCWDYRLIRGAIPPTFASFAKTWLFLTIPYALPAALVYYSRRRRAEQSKGGRRR